MEGKKLTPIENDYPIDSALCVFRTKDANLFFLGFMDWSVKDYPIRHFGKSVGYPINMIESYQYVLNENEGLLYVKKKA